MSSSTVIQGQPLVILELTNDGSAKFAEATAALKGQRISIYMDETLLSSPTVKDTISNGRASITGISSMDEAKDLADKINSGSLPFSLVANNCLILSPKLGSNALGVMVRAGEVAFALVCLFMLLYYRLPGLVACITLMLQVSGQLLALSVPQFSLTLPGIAGIILSIGMGVGRQRHHFGTNTGGTAGRKNAPKSHRPGLPEGVFLRFRR
jgi:protein-export membrane protein SecD